MATTPREIQFGPGATTLSHTWLTDGVAEDVDDVTIGIDDTDGNEIVASGTSTTNTSGVYTYDLAEQIQVKSLVVTWTDVDTEVAHVDTVEIIGGFLFTIPELQAFHASDLASTSTYPVSVLQDMRTLIADEFERICGVSFIPRFRKQSLAGDGGYVLEVDRGRVSAVIACTVSSVVVSAASFVADDTTPFIYRVNGTFGFATQAAPRNVAISYRHGYEQVELPVKRAALIAAHARLKKDVTGAGIPYNASTWNDATGQFVAFGVNDKTMRWFGIPEVDSMLRQYMERIPVNS